jgi:hypothetical protein
MMNKYLIILLCLFSFACSGPYGNPNGVVCVHSGFTPEHNKSIFDAANEWYEKTNGDVNLRLDNTGDYEDDCDLQIKAIPGPETVGSFHWDIGHTYNYTTIVLEDSVPAEYEELVPNWFYAIALHELGHYLTGPAHSTNSEDIMYKTQQPTVFHLTEDDVNRFYNE